jgi:NADPH:quinone reductase-like Zn-dependent oxidoreductase
MKASFIAGYGGTEVIRYGDLPDPVMQKNQILIEVKAVSINPVDYKTISGIIRIVSGFKFPKIIGSDYAGVIMNVGSEVTGLKPGDRVYGSSPVIFRKPGMLAQYAAIDPKYARIMPDSMTFEEASSLPIAALTALNGLRKGGVNEGKAVLVNGATGGVGHFAVQIAKADGSYVTATCSKENAEFAKQLGADEVIGYSREELKKTERKFDSIMDAYGKMNYEDVCRLLKKRGVYTSTLFFPPSSISAFFVRMVFNKKLTSANMRSLPEDYQKLEKLFLEKKLKPFIDKIFTLDKTADAFDYAEKGRPRGKVIIKI